MVITFALLMIFNISLYVIAVNTFAALFLDVNAVGLVPLAVMLTTAASAYLLHNVRPKLRFLPVPMLVLCFFPIQGFAAAIIMLLPCVYLTLTISLKRFDFDAKKFKDFLRFSVIVILLPFIVVLTEDIEQLWVMNYFPYLFIYIVSAICLNRLANNAKNVYSNPKVAAANLALVLGVVLILVVISSPPVLAALWRGVSFVVSNGLLPAVIFLVNLINRLSRRGTVLEVVPVELPYNGEEAAIYEAAPAAPVNPPLFLLILFGIVAAVALFFFFKRLFTEIKGRIRKRLKKAGQYLYPEYEPLNVEFTESLQHKERQPFFTPRDSRLAIRFHYRKFLKLCAEKGKAPEKGDTSEDINIKNKGIFSEPDTKRLRQLYIKARYSDKEVTREESKEAGKLTKALHLGS